MIKKECHPDKKGGDCFVPRNDAKVKTPRNRIEYINYEGYAPSCGRNN
jgi:hypothetical protein